MWYVLSCHMMTVMFQRSRVQSEFTTMSNMHLTDKVQYVVGIVSLINSSFIHLRTLSFSHHLAYLHCVHENFNKAMTFIIH